MDGFSRDYESIFHKVARCRREISLEKTKQMLFCKKALAEQLRKNCYIANLRLWERLFLSHFNEISFLSHPFWKQLNAKLILINKTKTIIKKKNTLLSVHFNVKWRFKLNFRWRDETLIEIIVRRNGKIVSKVV